MSEKFIEPIITRNISAGDHEGTTMEDEPLSPSARLFQSPQLNLSVLIVLGSKTLIDANTVKYGLMNSSAQHPRFSSLLVTDDENGGRMSWRRTEVDIHEHVFTPDLNPNMELADDFVEEYISDLTSTRFDYAKPLWELHILNVKTSDANATAVLKLHHSIGDGISIMSLFLASTRKASDLESMPSVPKTRRQTSLLNNNCNGFWGILCTIWTLIMMLFNTFVDAVNFAATAFFLKDTDNPIKLRTPEDARFTRRKRILHRIVSLDDIKLVKSAMNATINDVLLGITMASISRYLNEKYASRSDGYKQQHKASKEENNLPAKIRLRSTLMYNLRRQSTVIEQYAAMMHKIISNTTMAFSNVVGPREEISFYGHHVSFIAPSVFGHPQALTVHCQSYADKMILVLTVDPDVIPDYRTLSAEFEASLELIKNAVIERGLAVRVKKED
nr:PREDICTED: O-acyltransferase WSD1-like isoform X2 [Daucus carota subsp. sativus]